MQILTTGEAARFLEMSDDNVRLLEKAGKLKAFKTATGQRIFLRSEIEKFSEGRLKKIAQRKAKLAASSDQAR